MFRVWGDRSGCDGVHGTPMPGDASTAGGCRRFREQLATSNGDVYRR
jgi:hypothetical protein